MNRFIAYLQIGFATLLYLVSLFTFIDYLYSLTILDTVTAIENAFGKLIILVFLLVLARFNMLAGKQRLQTTASETPENGNEQPQTGRPNAEPGTAPQDGTQAPVDPGHKKVKKEADK